MEKQIIFNGIYFTILPSGYYISQNLDKPKGLHVCIWEFYSGKKVPRGWIVHHLDENNLNNEYSNLSCISRREHALIHGQNISKEARVLAIEKAKEWHRSDFGHKFHVENGKNVWEKKEKIITECIFCKSEFFCFFIDRRKYCSTKCRQKDYAKEGKGHEERTCLVCNKIFITSRFKKASTCSRSCSNRIRRLKLFKD